MSLVTRGLGSPDLVTEGLGASSAGGIGLGAAAGVGQLGAQGGASGGVAAVGALGGVAELGTQGSAPVPRIVSGAGGAAAFPDVHISNRHAWRGERPAWLDEPRRAAVAGIRGIGARGGVGCLGAEGIENPTDEELAVAALVALGELHDGDVSVAHDPDEQIVLEVSFPPQDLDDEELAALAVALLEAA